MMRLAIKEFQIGNPAYKGGTVTFYTVAGGVKTATKATLYAASTGTAQLANPQKLDSYGKFKQPVYIADPVIGTLEGLTVPTHDTGIITPAPTFRVNSATFAVEYSFDGGVSWSSSGDYFFRDRGPWAGATAYERTDMVTTSSGRYIAASDHVSTASFAVDLAAGKWVLFLSNERWIDVQTYGAKGDGVTDDTAAIQAALNTITGVTAANTDVANRSIYFPAGVYLVTATLLPPEEGSYVVIFGDSARSSKIKWGGAAGSPVWKFRNVRKVSMRDLSVNGKTTAKPSYLVQVHRDASWSATGAAMGFEFRNMSFGDGAGDHTTSVAFTADGGQDGNNEQAMFYECEFNAPSDYGVHFAHSNSLLHKFVGCCFGNYGIAAVNNVMAASNYHASFSMWGCTFAGNSNSTVLHLGQPRFTINLYNCAHENVAAVNTKVLTQPAAWTDGGEINMFGCQWHMGDPTAGQYNINFDALTAFSKLNVYASEIFSPNGVKFDLNGGRVRFHGGGVSTAEIRYNTEVWMHHCKQGAGAPTYTNVGAGSLQIAERSAGSAAVDVTPVITAGVTFAVDTRQSDVIVLQHAAPTSLATLTGGYIGQKVTLVAFNGNTTLTHQTAFPSPNAIFLKDGIDFKMRLLDSITLQRQDTVTGGGKWVEIDRSVTSTLTGNHVTADVGNVGGGTDDLQTYALNANALATNNNTRVLITAWGRTANNGNAKTVALLYGSQSLISLALTAGIAGKWRITAEIVRTGANTQDWSAQIIQGPTSLVSADSGTSAQTDNIANTIKCTGAGVADNDIVQEGMTVSFAR